MFLSRLILNAGTAQVRRDLADCHELHRSILSGFPDLPADPAATGDARSRLGVLFRLEQHPRTGSVSVLVQSRVEPDWRTLPERYLLDTGGASVNPEQKSVGAAFAAIQTGDGLVFRLRANPTRKVDTRSGADGRRRNGRRVALTTVEQQLGWLERKGLAGGFRLATVRASPGLGDSRTGAALADVADVDARPLGRVSGRPDGQDQRGTIRGQRLADPGAAGGAARRERLTFGDVLFEGRLVVTEAALFRETLEQGIGSGKAYGFGLLSVARVPG